MARPDDEFDPPADRGSTGRRVGPTAVALAPIVALVLFFVFGFTGGWAWSWLFFLLVPIVYIVAYGPSGPGGGRAR